MSSKEEIKNAFVLELKNTPEYQIVLAIKQAILNEIATPNVQNQVIYNFQTEQSKYSQGVISMCGLVEFGFKLDNISDMAVIIDMNKFLE